VVLLSGRTQLTAAWTSAWALYDWFMLAMGAVIARLASLVDTAQAVVACVPSTVAPPGLSSMVPTNDVAKYTQPLAGLSSMVPTDLVAQYTQLLASVASTVAGYRSFANFAFSLFFWALLAIVVVTLCLASAGALLHLWRRASTAKIILSPPAFFFTAILWLVLGITLVIDSVTEDACNEVVMVATNQSNTSLVAQFLQCGSPPSDVMTPIQSYGTGLYPMCRSLQTVCIGAAPPSTSFCGMIPTLCNTSDTQLPVSTLFAHCPTCRDLPGCNVPQVLGAVDAQIGPVTLQNFSQALEKAINGPTDMCEAARQELLTNLTAVCGLAVAGLHSTIRGTLALGLGCLAAAALLSLPSRWFHPLVPTAGEFDLEAPVTKPDPIAPPPSDIMIAGPVYCEVDPESYLCPTPHISFCDERRHSPLFISSNTLTH